MKSTFGKNLKSIRIECGLSQKELAIRLNTTQQRVSEWESGKIEPTLVSLLKLIRVLNVTFDELTENIE